MSQPIAGNESFSNINTIADQLPFVNAAVASLGNLTVAESTVDILSVDDLTVVDLTAQTALINGLVPASVIIRILGLDKADATNITVVSGMDTTGNLTTWVAENTYFVKVGLSENVSVNSGYGVSCVDGFVFNAALDGPGIVVQNVSGGDISVAGALTSVYVLFYVLETTTAATFDLTIAITADTHTSA